MNRSLSSIVSWLRAGYPDGIPPTDSFAVLALLARRLTNDEIKTVVNELMRQGEFNSGNIDIGAAVAQRTAELPSPADIERIRKRLAAKGWPLDDPHDDGDDS
ncbi:DUF3349 domain-containing protein [Mycobacterium sp.]|uniref:DUF3349 domain-containing protein n=1 Tax=Mycobacterium sp. TaxID=1785 RepID=UPI003A891EAF